MNIKDALYYDLCVIGAGSAGLSVAAGAAQLGYDTVLIEKAEMGGDCLNTGCVPSKALLAAAKAAGAVKKLDHYNQDIPASFTPHYKGAQALVQKAIARIAPHDSQERFEGMGVTVLRESAKFIDERHIKAGDKIIKARHFVIAAGSRAAIPPIKGLDKDKVLTNESIFDLKEKPSHLVIIGGGPIGAEMAQAHKDLGCKVTIITNERFLSKDEPEAATILRDMMMGQGIKIHENAAIDEVIHNDGGAKIRFHVGIDKYEADASHILIAAGRIPNSDGLDIEKAGITLNDNGTIKTDKRLRTNKKHIFAAGDIAGAEGGGYQFTHIAGYHAGIIVRNIIFKMPAKTNYDSLPWVTYTSPELAHIGMSEAQAREKYGDSIKVIKIKMNEIDRAITEKQDQGIAKLIASDKGYVLGVSLLAPHAGDMLGLWSVMIDKKIKLSAAASMIAPYPSYGEINKRLASAYYSAALFSDKTRFFTRILKKLPF